MAEIADYRRAAAYLLDQSPLRPRVAIVLGSGLGSFAERLEAAVRVPYAQIPGFPVSTAPGHAGELLLGKIGGVPAVVLSGRFHCYEGLRPEQTAFYVGVLRLMGVRALLLTNAAGCINPAFRPGEWMAVRDHLCFAPVSPCIGPNIDALGPRFFDMGHAYSARLRELAKECAARRGVTLREGVYAYMTGPQYETPAEIRALSLLGADAVGMSTVPEVIAAAHCGLETLCLSCLTNYAAGITGEALSGGEVTKQAAAAAAGFEECLADLVIAASASERPQNGSST